MLWRSFRRLNEDADRKILDELRNRGYAWARLPTGACVAQPRYTTKPENRGRRPDMEKLERVAGIIRRNPGITKWQLQKIMRIGDAESLLASMENAGYLLTEYAGHLELMEVIG